MANVGFIGLGIMGAPLAGHLGLTLSSGGPLGPKNADRCGAA